MSKTGCVSLASSNTLQRNRYFNQWSKTTSIQTIGMQYDGAHEGGPREPVCRWKHGVHNRTGPPACEVVLARGPQCCPECHGYAGWATPGIGMSYFQGALRGPLVAAKWLHMEESSARACCCYASERPQAQVNYIEACYSCRL